MEDHPRVFLSIAAQTIPDIPGLRRLFSLPGDLSDFEVAEYAFQRQRVKTGCTELPPHMLRIASVSLVYHDLAGAHLETLAEPEFDELGILYRLSEIFCRHEGNVYFWGENLALRSVLLCRAMLHGVVLQSLESKAINTSVIDLCEILSGDAQNQVCLQDYVSVLDEKSAFEFMEPGDPWCDRLLGDVEICRKHSDLNAVLCHFVLLRYLNTCGQLSSLDCQRQISELICLARKSSA